MKSFAMPNLVAILALSLSLVAAVPLEVDGSTSKITSETTTDVACSRSAVDNCVATLGLDATACFAQVCAHIVVPELKRATQPSTCTEDALEDCALVQYKNPDICFEELCLD
jgi:hypothetical protein